MRRTDFSGVAKAYRWMEWLSFGPVLQRTRCFRLEEMRRSRRALVLGDGDGRFLHRLLQINRSVTVDAVDFSPGMVRLAQRRVRSLGPDAGTRVRWFQADACAWQSDGTYDLIVSNFFLDCFTTEQVASLVEKLSARLEHAGVWINADFACPGGWVRLPARAIVRSLYAAFYMLAGLRVQRLPDDAQAFIQAGLALSSRANLCAGLLKSERWERGPLN